ncbi:MAG: NADH-quinone oxidoreductase subunit N [Acidobacteriia bacterium]|nr:NADH-quinone oxidoreductase subunit N [Terriglobia bacterium]MBV8907024.1 NADH-quinone oxidoreductase subunit N [Terriglobia bacterium]MBV9747036.1 NADH-quinone oxidoreductase subunit N [Terriglobia bacterium]
MPVSNFLNSGDIIRFLPEIILTIAATLLMVLDPIVNKRSSNLFGTLSIVALIAALFGTVAAYGQAGTAFGGMLTIDGFATFFRMLVIVVGILTVLPSYEFLARQEAETSEYHALLLYSIAGQCLMASANDLIMIFIGLEISSIASYVLAGYLRDDKRANEAALKYFLLGSFATGFFLYGVALIYGATGTVNLSMARAAITGATAPSPVFVGVAAALIFVGLGFKVSASPFQMWAPDVYQGAPTPVTAFLSAGPKAAAFAVFLRIFMTAFEPIGNGWEPLVWISALLSMSIGNFAALLQSNVKRLLAYSSIAHAGYVLVALTARSDVGTAAAMFYLAAYALMNIGAFAVVSHLSGKGERYTNVEDLAGLGQKQPLTAAMFAIFLLSLIGVPLTGGFFGKFYIFKAALESHLVWLTVLGLLNSAVAAYYYLRILVMMYMYEPREATASAEPLSAGLGAALILPAIGTLLLGIFPSWVLDFAGKSSNLLK